MLNNLFPSVKAYFTSLIKVFPRKTQIYPNVNVCNQNLFLSLDRQQNGYSNADLVIFLTGEYNKYASYIAWAAFCELDETNLNRPNVGMNFYNFYKK